MRFTTTDGKVYDVPDTCPCCSLSTGGGHQAGCPMADRNFEQGVYLPERKLNGAFGD